MRDSSSGFVIESAEKMKMLIRRAKLRRKLKNMVGLFDFPFSFCVGFLCFSHWIISMLPSFYSVLSVCNFVCWCWASGIFSLVCGFFKTVLGTGSEEHKDQERQI